MAFLTSCEAAFLNIEHLCQQDSMNGKVSLHSNAAKRSIFMRNATIPSTVDLLERTEEATDTWHDFCCTLRHALVHRAFNGTRSHQQMLATLPHGASPAVPLPTPTATLQTPPTTPVPLFDFTNECMNSGFGGNDDMRKQANQEVANQSPSITQRNNSRKIIKVQPIEETLMKHPNGNATKKVLDIQGLL